MSASDPNPTPPVFTHDEAAFQHLFERASDAMVLSDVQGIVLEANAAYLQLYGYMAGEVIGQPFTIIYPPEKRQETLNRYQQIFISGDPQSAFESVIQRKDGSLRSVESRISFIVQNEQRAAMLSIIRDITIQKKYARHQQFLIDAGHILASSQNYEETLTNVAKLVTPQIADWCAIDLLDQQGVIQRVAVTHVDPSKVAWAYQLQQQYPPSLEGETNFAKALKTGQIAYLPHITDALLITAAGNDLHLLSILRELDFSSSLIVPLVAHERTIGAITLVTTQSSHRVLTVEDVKLAQELARIAALAVDNAKLQNVLTLYTHDLKRSNEDLERFAYVASHDLQEPLRMITSYLQLLERRYGAELGQEAREFMDFAVDGANRMKLLITDLLAYSRITKDEAKFAPFNTADALVQAMNNIKLQMEENQTQVIYEQLPSITGNKNQFVQLFQNLLSNAIKFHDKKAPEIRITAQKQETGWLFAVQDNGIGIQSEHLERIFIMFHRLHERGEYPGTGIGLAICKKIVEYHQGRLWAESSPHQGTTFYFTLPPTQA